MDSALLFLMPEDDGASTLSAINGHLAKAGISNFSSFIMVVFLPWSLAVSPGRPLKERGHSGDIRQKTSVF